MQKPSAFTSMPQVRAVVVGLLVAFTLQGLSSAGHAESLFRASTSYTAPEPMKARSLFTPPISREVGDLITIEVTDNSSQTVQSELKITRGQTINQNGSSLYNSMLGFFLNKLPFNTSKINNALQAPSFNGLNNANNLDSKGQITRTNAFVDNIACQVVQVLPNGDLMVQGQKTIQTNKERTDLMVTGIVRPFYLDRNNQISSKNVANFQMIQGGKGVISRQQNDGISSKIYQFFN